MTPPTHNPHVLPLYDYHGGGRMVHPHDNLSSPPGTSPAKPAWPLPKEGKAGWAREGKENWPQEGGGQPSIGQYYPMDYHDATMHQIPIPRNGNK